MNIRFVLQYKRFKAHWNTKRTVNDQIKFLSLIKLIMVQLTTNLVFYCFALHPKSKHDCNEKHFRGKVS